MSVPALPATQPEAGGYVSNMMFIPSNKCQNWSMADKTLYSESLLQIRAKGGAASRHPNLKI
jgi:hypothetical protein